MMRFLTLLIALLAPIAATAQPAPGAPLVKSRNLGDVPSPATARTNLGLGTIATQAASAVAVTGGTIDGATIGATTPSSGKFTTLGASGIATAGGATAIADSTLAVQVSAALNTQAYFGANKAGAYGLLVGYNDNSGFLGGAGGLIRMVTTDPLRFVMNNNVQAASFDATGNFLEVNTLRGGHVSSRPDLVGGTTWSSGIAAEGVSNLYVAGSVTGTTGTGSAAVNYFGIPSDNLNCAASGAGACNGLLMAHNFGGAAMIGPRNVINGLGNLTSTSGNTTGSGASYVAGQFTMQAAVNDNGTALTTGGARGFIYGINPVAHLFSGATYFQQAVGAEVDYAVDTGASALDVIGMQIVALSSHAVPGTRDDVVLSLNSQSTGLAAVGLGFGRAGGAFPVSSSGTIIYGQGNGGSGFSVANGIDFHLGTFSGNTWNDGKTVLTGAGQMSMTKMTASGTAPGAGKMRFEVVAGTTGGTCKLISYAGTSTTPTTVIDNVGSGC